MPKPTRAPGAPAPATTDPFRPDERPSYPSTSMRSPFFSSTASRPWSMSVAEGYAERVPLERQGARSLTGGDVAYPVPSLGLRGALPMSYGALTPMQTRLRQARGPYDALVTAPFDYLAHDGNSDATWAALPMHLRQRWVRGFRLGARPADIVAPRTAPYDYLDTGRRQADWEALDEAARLRWVVGLRVGDAPAPEPAPEPAPVAPVGAPAPAPGLPPSQARAPVSWQRVGVVAAIGVAVALAGLALTRAKRKGG